MTGGTRGIGAAICHSLAGQGAAIVAGHSGNTERATGFIADCDRRSRRLGAGDGHRRQHRLDMTTQGWTTVFYRTPAEVEAGYFRRLNAAVEQPLAAEPTL